MSSGSQSGSSAAVGGSLATIAFLKPGRLERLLPGLDPLPDVAAPLGRRGRVEVVDDRLHRLDQFAAGVGRRVLRLQPPAADELLRRRLLLVEAVVHALDREEADPRIGDSVAAWARAGGAPATGASPSESEPASRRRWAVRRRQMFAYAALRRCTGNDLTHRRTSATGRADAPDTCAAALRRARSAPACRPRRSRSRRPPSSCCRGERLDREGRQDRARRCCSPPTGDREASRRRPRRSRSREAGCGRPCRSQRTTRSPIDVPAEVKPPKLLGHAGDARHEQEVAPHQRIGELEEPAIVDLVHRDAAGIGHRLVGDDLRVGPRSAARCGALRALSGRPGATRGWRAAGGWLRDEGRGGECGHDGERTDRRDAHGEDRVEGPTRNGADTRNVHRPAWASRTWANEAGGDRWSPPALTSPISHLPLAYHR